MTSLHATPQASTQDFDIWIQAFQKRARRRRVIRLLIPLAWTLVFLAVSVALWWVRR